MKAFEKLPEGYHEIDSIDLQKDKKLMLLVNVIALVIMIVLAVPMHFVIPISSMFAHDYFIKAAVLLGAMIVYIILHELIHGIAMKICGTKKVKYGFTGMYAFAGSDDYYDKKSYIFIALAPIVVWGIVLAVINFLVPTDWFWIVYFVQIMNLSGAAGDLFVTVKFSKLPRDILISD